VKKESYQLSGIQKNQKKKEMKVEGSNESLRRGKNTRPKNKQPRKGPPGTYFKLPRAKNQGKMWIGLPEKGKIWKKKQALWSGEIIQIPITSISAQQRGGNLCKGSEN